MSRRPNLAETMARKAAAAVDMVEDEPTTPTEDVRHAGAPEAQAPHGGAMVKGRGRPKGKREIDARMTVYLDSARHDALVRLANDRGRSVHSLILEGIDAVTGKPVILPYQ
jgi:hypothetical protein